MKSTLGKLAAPSALCSISLSLIASCLILIAFCLMLTGCAQTGAPLPPSLELPKPPTDLRAIRKGNRVTLSWTEPTLTTDRQSARYLGPTLVCRSLEPDMTVCGNPAALLSAPPAASKKSEPATVTPQTYLDNLSANLPAQDPTAELTYAVEVLNRNARGAGLSNRVHVPAAETLPAPSDLSVDLTGDGVVLTWTSAGGTENLPVLQHRYRIYRHPENSAKDAVAGEVPLSETGPTHFTDSSFEWEKTYFYRVTTVTIVKRPDGEVQIEGDDTPTIRVVAHDVFPPSAPVGLQAAYSGEGQQPFIDLIWAPVTNADLAGYNIYRTAGESAAENRVKVNSELVKSPSYRDASVTSGKTYTYTISAVDVRGNESQRSESASEPVP